jgi:iron complex outermembrane receptor protein
LYSNTALSQPTDEIELAMAYGDKDTVSLATGHRQSLQLAPSVASVITAEDITAMGATDIDEVLETVPGLHVNRAASMGTTQYVMRGITSIYAPQVLMLQNGIPVTVAITGNKGNLWGGLPVENIARIEVLRGPGSALYGADAFSGVINIITKTALEIQGTQYGFRAGSFGTRDAWIQHGGQYGNLSVAAYLRAGSTDGQHQTVESDAQTRNDARTGTSTSLAPGQINAGLSAVDGNLDLAQGKWRWRSGYKLRDDMETFAGIGQALDPVGKGRSERVTSDISWTDNNFAQGWSLSASAAFMQFKQSFPLAAQIYPPGTMFPTGTFVDGMRGGPEFSERQYRLSAHAAYTGFRDHSVRFGIGHDDLELYATREYRNFAYSATGVPIPNGALVVTPTPFIYPQDRTVDYVYLQDEWGFARDWTLTAGVRHDRYSDFGGTTNPRLALVWEAQVDLTAKLMYGSAFRAPAFVEQYSTNNPLSRGNPDIEPERNQTVELAFAWQARRELSLNLSLFHYHMRDIIRAVTNPAPVYGSTFQNTGSQHGSGFELEGAWDATRNLRLTGHYAAQKSIDETTGQDAGYAPRQHVYLRADWMPLARWMLSGQINYVADRHRAAGDTRDPVPDYTTLDLTLRTTQRGKGTWNFAASVRNLFDADAREPSLAPGQIANDLPAAPRTLWLQVTHDL